ncbi:uncharacterized protein LOC117332456 [Pecten maximus]|uniref:uncharacterized protein LOC117332456 n=1 Tax=Pecten maximus TaxID=6579 RepID=UPI0014588863|nr:uncharacterized protein LOC117332456 [Pecten maximus]
MLSGFSTEDKKTLEKLNRHGQQANLVLREITFIEEADNSLSHLIVKTVPENNLICERTLKYFQAIARKVWVVNMNWLMHSIKAGRLLPEEAYEIQGDNIIGRHYGPKSARTSSPILQGYKFQLVTGENPEISYESVHDLILRCGGIVVDGVSCLNPKEVILVLSKCTKWFSSNVLDVTWLLDTVSTNVLQPYSDYTKDHTDVIDTPQEPKDAIELAQDPKDVMETPQDPKDVMETPQDPKDVMETPQDPKEVMETPQDPKDVMETPQDLKDIMETPQDITDVMETPQDPKDVMETLQDITDVMETPQDPKEVMETPQDPKDVMETPQDPKDIMETPQDITDVMETPQDPKDVMETPQDPKDVMETPQDITDVMETPQDPKDVMETLQDITDVMETPQDPKEVMETPQDPKDVMETPQDPKDVMETPQDPKDVMETPQDPTNIIDPLQDLEFVIETPQDPKDVMETPQDPKDIMETLQDITNVMETPQDTTDVMETPQDPKDVMETPQDITDVMETPQDTTDVMETPQDPKDVMETPQDPKDVINMQQGGKRRGCKRKCIQDHENEAHDDIDYDTDNSIHTDNDSDYEPSDYDEDMIDEDENIYSSDDSSISEDRNRNTQVVNDWEKTDQMIVPSSEREDEEVNSVIFGNVLKEGITIQQSTVEGKSREQKRQCCVYCDKLITTLSRHMERKHSNEEQVAKILMMPKKSSARRYAWESLLAKGNYNHNYEVLEKGKGTLITKYRPRKGEVKEANKYVPCDSCYSFFIATDLWKHKRSCSGACGKRQHVKGGSIHDGKLLLPLTSPSKGLYKDVLMNLRDDEIGAKLQNDEHILKFGERLYEKIGHLQQNHQYISQRMRQLSRLLIQMKDIDPAIKSVEQCISPENWESLLRAVKCVSGLNEETGFYDTPSLPLKLGHSLQKCAKILKSEGTIEQNRSKQEKAESFLSLYNDDWNDRVSAKALTTLHVKKFNNVKLLPSVEDLSVFHHYLEEEAEKLTKDENSNFNELTEVCLAQVISFNRKRSGEAERIKMDDYKSSSKSEIDKEISNALSKFEVALLQRHSRIEIMGKKGSKVPILLTTAMKKNIDAMLSRRTFDSNYVFAKADSKYPVRGTDVLRKLSQKSGCKHPHLIRSTAMRKQLATVSQVLNLSNTDQDLLATFLGHDIRVHREYYRLPESTLEIAKVSKILHAVNEGNVASLQGKSLDEIQYEDTDVDAEVHDEDSEDEEIEREDDAEVVGDSEKDVHKEADSGQKWRAGGLRRKSFVRKPWTSSEKAAVKRQLGNHLLLKTLPGKANCEEVLRKEHVLHERTWKQLKDYIRNCNIVRR